MIAAAISLVVFETVASRCAVASMVPFKRNYVDRNLVAEERDCSGSAVVPFKSNYWLPGRGTTRSPCEEHVVPLQGNYSKHRSGIEMLKNYVPAMMAVLARINGSKQVEAINANKRKEWASDQWGSDGAKLAGGRSCSGSLRFASLDPSTRTPSAPDFLSSYLSRSRSTSRLLAVYQSGSERSERTHSVEEPKATSPVSRTPCLPRGHRAHTPHCEENRGLCSFRVHAWHKHHSHHSRPPQGGPR